MGCFHGKIETEITGDEMALVDRRHQVQLHRMVKNTRACKMSARRDRDGRDLPQIQQNMTKYLNTALAAEYFKGNFFNQWFCQVRHDPEDINRSEPKTSYAINLVLDCHILNLTRHFEFDREEPRTIPYPSEIRLVFHRMSRINISLTSMQD